MMYGKYVGALAAVCTVSAAMTAPAYGATTTMNLEKKAVKMLGIMSVSNLEAEVSRDEFASMLVKASEYRYIDHGASNVSVYADVLNTNEYASAIRIAVSNEWMTGFLGGNFKPEQGVTLREAARAVLTMLGYSNADFAGNINENRMAKFSELGLDANIRCNEDDILTNADCVHLFYNLMKTDMKNGSAYGSKIFDLTFSSDGEVNLFSIVDDSVKGPVVLERGKDLNDIVPFSLKNASMFLNGYASDEDEMNDEALLVYYHSSTKTIFGYSADGENKGATKGEITAIYYDSSDPFAPVSIELDSDDQDNAEGGDIFRLNESEIQYLFSIYGELQIGDEVVIVWEKNGNGENVTYTAIDAVGDN